MLREVLNRRGDVGERWLDEALSSYSEQAVTLWRREKDAFANPVGHALREGTRAVIEWLLDGGDADAARAGLDRILQVRAVQSQTPAEAVGFVFRLKAVVRSQLGETIDNPLVRRELAELETRIDEAGLAAFDLYTAHRERLFELRVAELKRTIPWAATRAEVTAAERRPG